jgi:tRNA threonylcarbamoyladenosine biosynthesis protein TsaE
MFPFTIDGKYICNMEVIFTIKGIKAAAQQLLALAAGTKVLAFEGDMGAGKTTFIHALCEVMGVVDVVSSPTYAIINQYLAALGQTVYHIDLYRLKDEEEAVNAGVEDCLYSGNRCFVEWPQRAPGIFPADTMYVSIAVIDATTRKLAVLQIPGN